MICRARADCDPAFIACAVDLGGNKVGCACRVAVEAAIKGEETRAARVPDSAREDAT